jgi:type III secretory pathway component EscU
MKKIMLSVIAVMCLVGFSSLSFAADMEKMKDEMKGEMKEMKGEMKEKMGEMKGKMKEGMGK